MITILDYALVLANGVVYAFIAVALLIRRKSKPLEGVTLEESFRILETELGKAYPDLGNGYTWQEIVQRLRTSNSGISETEWSEIENVLKKYEAFRYGGVNYGDVDPHSVVMLARRLPRGEIVAS